MVLQGWGWLEKSIACPHGVYHNSSTLPVAHTCLIFVEIPLNLTHVHSAYHGVMHDQIIVFNRTGTFTFQFDLAGVLLNVKGPPTSSFLSAKEPFSPTPFIAVTGFTK